MYLVNGYHLAHSSMKPTTPVALHDTISERVYGQNQEGVEPLPVIPANNGMVLISRWELTDDDIAAILEHKSIWLQLHTFGRPPQPVLLTTEHPIFQTDTEFDPDIDG